MHYKFFFFPFKTVAYILGFADVQLYLMGDGCSPPVGCSPVAFLAQFSVELETPSPRAESWAGGCVCCTWHGAWRRADPPTWENLMASRAGQPGGVWVPSARDRVCGFECSSVGWGPVAVERNGEGGQEPWPRGEAGLERWGPPGGKGGARSCFFSGLATRSDRLVAASAEEQGVRERLGGCGSAPSGRTRPPGVREIPRARLAAGCVRSVLGPAFLLQLGGLPLRLLPMLLTTAARSFWPLLRPPPARSMCLVSVESAVLSRLFLGWNSSQKATMTFLSQTRRNLNPGTSQRHNTNWRTLSFTPASRVSFKPLPKWRNPSLIPYISWRYEPPGMDDLGQWPFNQGQSYFPTSGRVGR